MAIRLRDMLFFVGIQVWVGTCAYASSVQGGKWETVRFEEIYPRPLDRVTVEASMDINADRLSLLHVTIGNRSVAIPKRAYTDLAKPQLQSLSVSYGSQLEDGSPSYAVVEFYFGDPITQQPFDEDAENRDRFSSVQIRLEGDRAVSRMIFRAENGGSSTFEKL